MAQPWRDSIVKPEKASLAAAQLEQQRQVKSYVDGSAMFKDGSVAWSGTGVGFRDEDDMSSDDATACASQQSIKAYTDTELAAAVAKIGYVDRGDPAAWDWAVGALTTDNTWNDLDCSSIVPANAVAIHFTLHLQDDVVASLFELRKNGNSDVYSAVKLATQIANVTVYGDVVCGCDTSRVVEYRASNLTWTDINIVVRGWWLNG